MEYRNSEQNYFMNYSFDRVNFLSVLYFNARSLLPKMDEIKLLVVVHNPDVISITDTSLSPDISDGDFAISDYLL